MNLSVYKYNVHVLFSTIERGSCRSKRKVYHQFVQIELTHAYAMTGSGRASVLLTNLINPFFMRVSLLFKSMCINDDLYVSDINLVYMSCIKKRKSISCRIGGQSKTTNVYMRDILCTQNEFI